MEDDLRQKFRQLSKNELVGIARTGGSQHAHKGLSADALIDLIDTGEEPVDPVDPLRREIMTYITAHQSQLTLTCHGDCFRHSWAQVFQCHSRLKGPPT